MTIRKRDLYWSSTGAMLVAAVVMLGLGQWTGLIVLVAALLIGWMASGTSISTGSAPVWLMPPTVFPEPEDEVKTPVVDDGYVPFFDHIPTEETS